MNRLLITAISIVALSLPPAAQDQTIQTLQKIADAPGPSGFEEPIRKVMVDYMRPLSNSLLSRLWP
jgi:endoglucanase